jgi:hypothetical protein
MGEEAKKRIADALEAGYTKDQIAESFDPTKLNVGICSL